MTDDIKLPPLPYPQIPGNDYDPSDMWNYARAAIKFDRQQRGEPTQSEAVYAFSAWLTTRKHAVAIGSTQNAAIVAELVNLFVDSQGWDQPRDDYIDHIRAYPSEAPQPAPAQPDKQSTDDTLWCLHILGPDELHPAPSKAVAETAADLHNATFDKESKRTGVMCKAAVEPWPFDAESHALDVGEFVENWLDPQPAAPAPHVENEETARMTTEKILTDPMATDLAWEYATGILEVRAIEQAVLQSPEIQSLRRDAERYRWLNKYADPLTGPAISTPEDGKPWPIGRIDDAIDAAMEQQK